MIYVAIVDDNAICLEDIKKRCKCFLKDVKHMVRGYESYEALLEDHSYFEKTDLLISDIELQDKNGIEEAQKIKLLKSNLCVLFISSYIKYAPMVYDVDHLYFVLKDQLDIRFDKAMKAAMGYIESIQNKTLVVKWKGKVECIPIVDIVVVERQNRKTRIVTQGSEYFTYTPFQEIVDMLENDNFIRVHYSYYIHLQCVKHFERDHIILSNDEYIPVSRTYEKEAKEAFLQYLSSEVFF